MKTNLSSFPVLGEIAAHSERAEGAVAALSEHPRAVICGGPRCGKTTVAARAAERYRRRLLPGDGLVGLLEWSDASAEVARWIDLPGNWVIEGVVAARALRKWLAAHPGERLPCVVMRLETPVHARSADGDAMAKGEATVWESIAGELLRVATVIAAPDGQPFVSYAFD